MGVNADICAKRRRPFWSGLQITRAFWAVYRTYESEYVGPSARLVQTLWTRATPHCIQFIFVEVELPTHHFVKNESVSSIQKAWHRRFPCFETFRSAYGSVVQNESVSGTPNA